MGLFSAPNVTFVLMWDSDSDVTLRLNISRQEGSFALHVTSTVQPETPWTSTVIDITESRKSIFLQNKHVHLFVVFVAGGLAEVDAAIDAQLEREPDGRWRCLSCLDYSSVSRQTAKAHVESKHISSAGFMCHVCAKTCPTRHALKMHKIRNKH